MGIFSGLEALGFKNKDMNVYDETTKEAAAITETVVEEETTVTFNEEEYLFPKTYHCPVCDKSFKALAVRAGKLRSIGQDDDLRPLYKEMDPVKYDAILCPHCGYAALLRYFDRMMPHQGKKLRAEVMANFKGMDISDTFYSYDEAIMRYKMVLMCDVVGGVKVSRRAYTCLKLAWVIRGKLENEGEYLSLEEKNRLYSEELECIQNAYDGYVQALSSEMFPMSGMDEQTVTCLLAELAYELKKYRESLLLISQLLGNKNLSPRVKDKMLQLKDKIREQLKG